LFINDKTKIDESKWALVNMTPSRKKFIDKAKNKNIIYSESNAACLLPTLTTKQDR
jgi:hypothetical protein